MKRMGSVNVNALLAAWRREVMMKRMGRERRGRVRQPAGLLMHSYLPTYHAFLPTYLPYLPTC